MVAEIVKAFRAFTRPLRREFWWPRLDVVPRPDRPGVVLVSLTALEPESVPGLQRLLPHYQAHSLTSGELPPFHGHEHVLAEEPWFAYYRCYLFLRRTLTRLGPLWKGEVSWSRHLRESDDLARLYGGIVAGRDFIHLATSQARPLRLLRRLKRLLNGLEKSRYEVWVVDRQGQTAYLPGSLQLPTEPLTPREVSLLAQGYSCLRQRRSSTKSHAKQAGVVRLMTYNLHSCVGLDGRLSVERIAEVLHRYDPDFVALQEIDRASLRSLGVDQLAELKRLWAAEGEFFPLLSVGGGEYGIGFLSRLPVVNWQGHVLPLAAQLMPQEPRGMLSVLLRLPDGTELEVVNTHLGLTKKERAGQLDGLLRACLESPTPSQVLLGDFNCSPASLEYRRVASHFAEAQSPPQKTWFGTFPIRHLDYGFVRGRLKVESAWVPRDAHTRVASDHLPLLIDIRTD